MQPRGVALLLVLVFASVVWAGCLGPGDGGGAVASDLPEDPVVPTTTGAKPSSALTKDDKVESASWRVGQWFGHHVYLPGDEAGRHYETVVVKEEADGWFLAAADRLTAREEAVLDLPVAGAVGRDLQTTGYGLDWSLYRFPLHDGKTWSADVAVRDVRFWEVREYRVTFGVAFEEEIEVAGKRLAGFRITGTTGEGVVLFEHDYVPAIGWYANLVVHDVEAEDGGHLFRAVSMGHGDGWTGTYHVDEAELVLEHVSLVSVFPDALGPAPAEAFPVAAGHDLLYAFTILVAWNGAQGFAFVDPEGGVREARDVKHAGPEGVAVSALWLELPPTPGDWHVVMPGAGGFTAAVAIAWAVSHSTGSL
jgi:hypothetical protein